MCAFLAAVDVRRFRQVLLAELVFDVSTRHRHGISREVGRVGTHISDVAGFVKTLGHHHGFLHAEAQAVARSLLQGRCDERRRRLAAGRFVFALDDAVAGSLELLQRGHGLGFIERLEGFAFLAGHVEAHGRAFCGAEVGVNFPVLFRVERADFTFALDHQLHGNRLHATGGQTASDLGPQQRRNHVTHHAVEEATRLLGVDAVDIQLARLGEGFLDRLLGDFVEHHALVAAVVTTDGFAQVPGNGFPLAVQVGCEIDGVSILGEPAQLFDDFFLAREDLVLGFPAMVRIDTHARDQLLARFFFRRQCRRFTRSSLAALGGWLFAGASRTAGGQVSDMADTRLHHVLVAQILVDGLGLSRGFHNDQRFAHGSENS
ncbi:hypothetical protein D3C76_723160 [compost metagenome]